MQISALPLPLSATLFLPVLVTHSMCVQWISGTSSPSLQAWHGSRTREQNMLSGEQSNNQHIRTYKTVTLFDHNPIFSSYPFHSCLYTPHIPITNSPKNRLKVEAFPTAHFHTWARGERECTCVCVKIDDIKAPIRSLLFFIKKAIHSFTFVRKHSASFKNTMWQLSVINGGVK